MCTKFVPNNRFQYNSRQPAVDDANNNFIYIYCVKKKKFSFIRYTPLSFYFAISLYIPFFVLYTFFKIILHLNLFFIFHFTIYILKNNLLIKAIANNFLYKNINNNHCINFFTIYILIYKIIK